MDVVWLKRDARLHDHGPLWKASTSGRAFCILFLYEPDQLCEQTVHGSHICFVNEGLEAMDKALRTIRGNLEKPCIKYVKDDAISSFNGLHASNPIARILAHQETGHLASYARDRRVRRWCKQNRVVFDEIPQSGVVRCLRDREQFSRLYAGFISCQQYPTPDVDGLRSRLVTDLPSCGILGIDMIPWVSREHACDRPDRQVGGEQEALACWASFLTERGEGFSRGISAPSTAWKHCSRLSAYLAWGQLSLRRVAQELSVKQDQLRQDRKITNKEGVVKDEWLKSLAAFHSRIRWRSHFMQKLEAEPELEHRAACIAYDHVRTEPQDWNQDYFNAWASGRTGFVMIDACMRCLLQHGWVNFRMRAMLVSFACYNLWLDWRRIAPHLARCFLDYEPGIHYPQLQMQAGVTGINAMRVYSPTKQAKDNDKDGSFIRKYIPELRNVPDKHIHEPHKMPLNVQRSCGVFVNASDETSYPLPIVDEQESAKSAKSRLYAIRRMEETKKAAQQVLEKHGSRRRLRGKRRLDSSKSHLSESTEETEDTPEVKRSSKRSRIGTRATKS